MAVLRLTSLSSLALVLALGCDPGAGDADDASAPPDDGGVVAPTDATTPDPTDAGRRSDGGPPVMADAGPEADAGTPPPGGWAAPIGIPTPEFGIAEGVDSSCGALTERPFTDLDTLGELPAGSVVTIPEGTHFGSRFGVTIGGSGTPCQPIIVRGDPAGPRPLLRTDVTIAGSYVIVEGLEMELSNRENDRVRFEGCDHCALRHSDLHGVDVERNSTVVSVTDSTHTVIWDNEIHDNGDFSLPGEIDIHGIGGSGSWDTWIVDNHIHHNRGDGIQFGHRQRNTLGRFYIGRNHIHDNGENSVDIKEASDVVISENRLHDEPLGPVVLHDCPLNAAVLYNDLSNAEYLVSLPSLESACDAHTPVHLFVLGNDLHDATGDGVQGWGGGKRYFIAGNTFARVGTTISVSPRDPGSQVSEDDSAFESGAAEFERIYGLDIRRPSP